MSSVFTPPAVIPTTLAGIVAGTVSRLTTDKRKWAASPVIFSDPANTDKVLVGYNDNTDDAVLPTAILTTGAGTGQVNALRVIGPGDQLELEEIMPRSWRSNGEQFQLCRLVFQAAGGNQTIRLTYARRGRGTP